MPCPAPCRALTFAYRACLMPIAVPRKFLLKCSSSLFSRRHVDTENYARNAYTTMPPRRGQRSGDQQELLAVPAASHTTSLSRLSRRQNTSSGRRTKYLPRSFPHAFTAASIIYYSLYYCTGVMRCYISRYARHHYTLHFQRQYRDGAIYHIRFLASNNFF